MDGSPPPPRGAGHHRRAVQATTAARCRDDGAADWRAAPCPTEHPGRAGPGSGPARGTDIVLPVLEALGQIRDGRWTVAAETVLWRGLPGAWGPGFEADKLFLDAVETAVATMPASVRDDIDRRMRITAADVAQSATAVKEARLRWGRNVRIGPARTSDQVRAQVPMLRETDLDRVFFHGWWLGRGWLHPAWKAHALEIVLD